MFLQFILYNTLIQFIINYHLSFHIVKHSSFIMFFNLYCLKIKLFKQIKLTKLLKIKSS